MGYDWSHSPQPVMSDAGSTMSGLAGEFIGLAIDDARNSYWNKRQQEQYRQNMQEQFDMGQQAQRMAARNQVAGLEAAGLSPVLAHSAAGAPVGSSQMPTLPSLSRFSPLEVVQMKNIEANTEKTEAETRLTEAAIPNTEANTERTQADTAKIFAEIQDLNVKIETGKITLAERQEYNQAIAKSMPALCDMIVSVPGVAEKNPKLYEWMLSLGYDKPQTSGALRALSDFVAQYGQSPEQFRKQITDSFMLENKSYELDYRLSEEQVDYLAGQITNIVASTKKLYSDIDLNKSNVSLNDARKKEINAHIDQINQAILEMQQHIKTMQADAKLKYQLANSAYYDRKNLGEQVTNLDWKASMLSQWQNTQELLGSILKYMK